MDSIVRSLAFFFVGAFFLVSCSSDSQDQSNPTVSVDPVLVYAPDPERLEDTRCTATKISPTRFLTAAHCVLDQPERDNLYKGEWIRGEHYEVGALLTYSFSRELNERLIYDQLRITKVILPPSLEVCLSGGPAEGCHGGRTPVPDLAVIEAVSRTQTFENAPVARLRFEPVSAEDRVVMIGYGLVSQTRRGLRLRGHTTGVLSPDRLTEVLRGTEAEWDGFPNFANFIGTGGSLLGDAFQNLGAGDSGGPLFQLASGAVVAVNSDGYCPLPLRDCEQTTNSTFARLHDQLWLQPLR